MSTNTIQDILCVPGLTCNLLFVEELMDDGLLGVFDAERCLIITEDSNPLVITSGLQDTNSILRALHVT